MFAKRIFPDGEEHERFFRVGTCQRKSPALHINHVPGVAGNRPKNLIRMALMPLQTPTTLRWVSSSSPEDRASSKTIFSPIPTRTTNPRLGLPPPTTTTISRANLYRVSSPISD
ncbi:MAG: hypothetical protein M0Q91_18575 [Methanoregula sp.]|nr:hypothetical protein [Methanoregula sp.]